MPILFLKIMSCYRLYRPSSKASALLNIAGYKRHNKSPDCGWKTEEIVSQKETFEIFLETRSDKVFCLSSKGRCGNGIYCFIGSILHRHVSGELVDRTSPDLQKLIKKVV